MVNPLDMAIEIIIQSINPDKLKKGVSHRRKLAQQIYRFLYGVGVPIDII